MNRRRSPAVNRSAGFSMVELMIALTIGLLVAISLGYVFMSSKATYNSSEGMSRVQESSRSAFLVTNSIIRHAGFLPSPKSQVNPALIFTSPQTAVFGGKASAVNTQYTWAPTPILPATVTGTNDYLEVAFVGFGSPADTTLPVKDCGGRPVASTEISVNVFYVTQLQNDTVPSLVCMPREVSVAAPGTVTQAAPGAPYSIINGVTNMAVTYGLDTDGDLVTDTYVADLSTGLLPTGMNWSQVKSITLQLTIESQDIATPGGADVATSATNTHGVSGGRLVRQVSQTIELRNRLIP